MPRKDMTFNPSISKLVKLETKNDQPDAGITTPGMIQTPVSAFLGPNIMNDPLALPQGYGAIDHVAARNIDTKRSDGAEKGPDIKTVTSGKSGEKGK